MDHLDFAGLQHLVGERRLSRRDVLKRAAGLGLTAPTIAALLAACGGSTAPTVATSVPTAAATTGSATTNGGTAASPTAAAATPVPAAQKAGGGGSLRILWWQAPTILNPHLSLAGKDVGAIRIYGEPLADF
ncbi:MAG TPA: peptide ABC transporter substrate-binding protein, partial [Thermomicrobiaceae bacterium]|nr:peptide ABC transporter substrate-binding protein [Thermomicrobiaceae bacterium]